ncbi:MAG: carboxymuconolactone decarboxylase family protein [Gammaproteobacteria bacterium]
MIPDEQASPELERQLDRVRTPHGTVDNVMRVHSLRPHTMHGHYTLYMSALHHPDNTLEDWLLETIASYTSILNRCDYSLSNHWANARHLIGDEARAEAIYEALQADAPERALEGKALAFARYARKLTLHPGAMERADVDALEAEGANDGEILEVNQVCCYFNYVNRVLNGLGVSLHGDTVGYYSPPGDSREQP